MKLALSACALVGFATVAQGQLINEFRPNPPGSDPATQDFELLGTPSDSFSGWIVSVESDSTSSTGLVDRASQVSGTFDANGLLVVSVPDLENPSFNVFLVDNFTGTIGSTDIDVDNDGTADDFSTFGTIFDAIGSPDNVGDEAFGYAGQAGGTNLSFIGSEPELVFRDRVSLALYSVEFDGEVWSAGGTLLNNADFDMDPTAATFGGVNPAIPAPGSLALLGLGGLAMTRRRR